MNVVANLAGSADGRKKVQCARAVVFFRVQCRGLSVTSRVLGITRGLAEQGVSRAPKRTAANPPRAYRSVFLVADTVSDAPSCRKR
jgi:hypothetical protein